MTDTIPVQIFDTFFSMEHKNDLLRLLGNTYIIYFNQNVSHEKSTKFNKYIKQYNFKNCTLFIRHIFLRKIYMIFTLVCDIRFFAGDHIPRFGKIFVTFYCINYMFSYQLLSLVVLMLKNSNGKEETQLSA